MNVLGGDAAELLASIGAVAAGGAFIGSFYGLVLARLERLDRPRTIERLADLAAKFSAFAVALAVLEEVLR